MNKILITLICMCFSIHSNAQKYSIGSNLAGIAVGSLNIEASLALSHKLSLHLPVMWSPFTFRDNIKLTHLALLPGIRVWNWHVFSGLYTALNASYIRYNGGVRERRYDGSALGISLSAGYSKMLSRRWNLEIEAGAGLFHTEHDIFVREVCGEYLESSRRLRVLPSRASLNLIFIL